MMKGFIKYQSLVLLLVGCLLFYGMYTWTNEYIERTDERTEDQRNSLVKCSELQVNYVDREFRENSTTVFFTVNRPLEAIKISFRGRNNASTVIRDVEENSVYTASANISGVRKIGAVAQECSELPN